MSRPETKRTTRNWRDRYRQNADLAARVAAGKLAQSGRIVRPRVSRKESSAAA